MISILLFLLFTAAAVLICLAVWTPKRTGAAPQAEGFWTRRTMFFFVGALLAIEVVCFVVIAVATGLSHGTNDQLYWTKQISCFVVVVLLPLSSLLIHHFSRRRWLGWTLLLVCLLALGSSVVTIAPGFEAQVRDDLGNPLDDAQIFYQQTPAQNGPSSTYSATRTDRRGHFRIWTKTSVHFPFLYTTPFHRPLRPATLKLFILSPRLHHLTRIENAFEWNPESSSDDVKIMRVGEEPVVVLKDLSDSPEGWFRTLHNLRYAASILYTGGSAAEKGEFIALWRAEYAQFVSRYGNVPRAPAGVGEETMPWSFYLQQKDEHGRSLAEQISMYERIFSGGLP